jgi:integrase/recombinase XerD
MAAQVDRYLEWMLVHGYAEGTIKDRRSRLRGLLRWCEERDVRHAQDITRPLLERYQRWLFFHRNEKGHALSLRSQSTQVTTVRRFFAWLAREHQILYNPASELELPRQGLRLPAAVLTAQEAERVLAQPDVETPLGVRDRAILETLYSTGCRRVELLRIEQHDLDRSRGTLIIRQGKGRKDRVVPIGERALHWIDRYLGEVRPHLASASEAGSVVFLMQNGKPFTPIQLWRRVHDYVSVIGKPGACHLFRHSMATLMLENGADIRYIQEILGHAQLSTTQIYTRVSIAKLKAIHTATHPTARLAPPSPARRPSGAEPQ